MNDIKFRYYDKFNGVMSNPSDEYNCIADFFADYENFLYAVNIPELMQFTGLQDKNGVDIYEGDIAVVYNCVDRGDGLFDDSIVGVFMIDGAWSVGFSDNCYEERLYDIDHEISVIGNIHQNPELLESK